MAKEPEQQSPPTSTNALLAQILQVDQDILTTNKAILVALGKANDSLGSALTVEQAQLKVQTDSRDYLKNISDAIAGEGSRFTVLVQQIADKVAAKLKR